MRLSFLVLACTLAACSSAPEGPVTEDGRLAVGDHTLGSGEYYDSYDVRLTEGQYLRATLESGAFDPYLIVRPPQGQQYDLDDSTTGDTTRVTLVVRAETAGTFQVMPTSFRPGAVGDYRLTYEVTDAEPSNPEADPPASGAAPPDGTTDAPKPDATDTPTLDA